MLHNRKAQESIATRISDNIACSNRVDQHPVVLSYTTQSIEPLQVKLGDRATIWSQGEKGNLFSTIKTSDGLGYTEVVAEGREHVCRCAREYESNGREVGRYWSRDDGKGGVTFRRTNRRVEKGVYWYKPSRRETHVNGRFRGMSLFSTLVAETSISADNYMVRAT